MTTRLQLYNDALLLVGERGLGDTTGTGTGLNANEETRRLLDQVWNSDGVDACLEEGQWQFAMRTILIDYDPGIEPDFGYQRAFQKPSDWILTSALCSDEYFKSPLIEYADEAGYWYADVNELYVRYVSNDASYGGDLASWPRSFAEFVAAHFASKIVYKLTDDEAKIKLFVNPENPLHSIRGRALLDAKSRCAMSGPTKFPPPGSWTRARRGGSSGRDGGNINGPLIG